MPTAKAGGGYLVQQIALVAEDPYQLYLAKLTVILYSSPTEAVPLVIPATISKVERVGKGIGSVRVTL